MKRKLVKRPLREYGEDGIGEVYGYEWSLWDCGLSIIALGGSSAGLGAAIAAGPLTWGAALALSSAVVLSGVATYQNCKWW